MKKLYTFVTEQRTRRMFIVFATALFVFAFSSSISAADLKTEWADASEVQGTFTVMLYGCNGSSDVNNLAILKKEGEGKPFGIGPPPFDLAYFGVKTGLEGRDAIAEAKKFLSCGVDIDHTLLSKITDSDGTILGFELKPQYNIEKFGTANAFFTHYIDNEDSITVQMIPNLDIGKR
jgi:hypothetical protein